MNKHLLFLESLGTGELFVIVLFVLIFFGSDKIPSIMKNLGKAMREFRTAMDNVKQDIESSVSEPVQSMKRELTPHLEDAKTEVEKSMNEVKRNIEESSSKTEQ
jgi:sec-independent protein translocase protein TatA